MRMMKFIKAVLECEPIEVRLAKTIAMARHREQQDGERQKMRDRGANIRQMKAKKCA